MLPQYDRGADVHAIHGAGLGSRAGYAPRIWSPRSSVTQAERDGRSGAAGSTNEKDVLSDKISTGRLTEGAAESDK